MDIIKFSHKLIEYDYNTKKYNDLLKFIFSHQLSNFNIKKIVKKNIKLNNNLIGGGSNSNDFADLSDLEEYKINDNIYIVRLVHGDSTDIKGKTHTIKFISIDDLNEKSLFCAILNFDYELKIAYLQGIGDYINCVLCANRLNEYKVAQILMNIILHLCKEKKPKIKYIELQDNSTLKCMKTYKPNPNLEWNNQYQNHDSMLLNILRTLQFGEPYYLKYGF
jgi:hypothetical protein